MWLRGRALPWLGSLVISKNCLYLQNNKRYDILTVLSNRYPATGGGEHMEIVISFFVTVAAGVTCHLICKWLDGHNKDNK